MDQSAFSIFAAIVSSIVLEASPFLLLGSLLSAVLAVYVGDGALTRLSRRGLPAQIGMGLVAGLILPTCECGVVPVTRRLLNKGVPPGAAVSFMLAAPVVNPVCLAATWVAFQGDWRMVAWRAALVMVPAAAVAWVLGGTQRADLLRPTLAMANQSDNGCGCACGHEHEAQHDHGRHGFLRGLPEVLRLTGLEFLDMALFLIAGALAAGAFKAFLPQSWLGLVSGNLWLAVPALMLLAVLISICSEADAFVAASLSMFPRPALLAFLTLGPMLDLKLMPAFLSVFKRRPALVVITLPALTIFVLCISLGLTGVIR
ncbi:MAG: hypothetical protein AUJ49_11605 [Desulfovibrionaceae bacterium CG1_02_65_16]|nr:MAG: hypothetical protein AUJ49_11605 [Desulfovibrionaceae bacterium CG1_02_65_16]